MSTEEWRNYLRKTLKGGITEVVVRGTKGSIYKIRCTLNEDIIRNRAPQCLDICKMEPDVLQPVYDLERDSIRIFRWDGLLRIT